MKKQTLFFDLDGTLLDTLDDITQSVNYALKKFDLKEKSRNDVRKALGYGAKALILTVTENDPRADKILEVYQNYYNKHSDVLTKPYEGILEMLTRLKMMGYQLAVISNKAKPMVEEMNKRVFKNIFDYAMGDTPELKVKPAPDMVFAAMDALHVSRDEVLFIGDSDVDVQTAKNASVDVIAVTWGFRDKDVLMALSPSFIIDEPEHIFDILDIINT